MNILINIVSQVTFLLACFIVQSFVMGVLLKLLSICNVDLQQNQILAIPLLLTSFVIAQNLTLLFANELFN